ncbi:RNA-binding domain-containing protein [Actinoplanes couchii]|nr:RNA-binding domain-containing protein [Actinoplanes couchii]MDR6321989.1 hypothetical protein [Actinoplanes couchii]
MLDMDVTKQPRRIGDWAAVLNAVLHADENDEQTWLEWKSTLALRSREQMAKIVAKAIIAMANRDPDKATATVGGIGILLIGIEPGTVHGVEPVDNADLDQLISPYVGADGPVWNPHWTQCQGQTVLVIEIAAPQWGDPIHTFRKEYPTVPDGTVFVRKLARSVRADHVEIARLADRRGARIPDQFDVSVGVETAAPLSRYGWHPEHLERFLKAESQALMKPIIRARATRAQPRGRRPSDGTIAGILGPSAFRAFPDIRIAGLGAEIPEDRTEDQFEAEVGTYIDAVRTAWPETMRQAARRFLSPSKFVLTNNSNRNYQDVLVELHVAGDAEASGAITVGGEFDLWSLLPKPPRSWGPRENPIARLGDTRWHSTISTPSYYVPPTYTIDNGGSFTLAFTPVTLRPQQRLILADDICVLIPSTRMEPVIATWTATATNADGPPATGRFTIEMRGEDLDVLTASLSAGSRGERKD